MLSTIDIVIIVGYLVAMLILGFVLGRKETADGFFVNSRKTRTFLLIFTALSTSVGAGTVIGVAGAAYNTGISFGLSFALISILAWLFIAWLAPVIKRWGDKLQAYTFGDFLRARFSKRTQVVGSVVTVIAYFFNASIQFVAFATLAKIISGVSFEVALLTAGVVTILYTIFAGIKGDFYTDALQFFVMIPVFVFLFYSGFSQIPVGEIFSQLPTMHLNIFNYSGPGFFVGSLIFGFPLLLVSMEIWQRIFAAKDAKTARRAFLWSGILKITVIVAAVLLGFLAFHLVDGGTQETALFDLMLKILPSGALGIGFASILAILMSTIDSMLMVGSATLTKDFYLQKHPNATEKQTLKMGRLFVFLFGACALVLALFYRDIVGLAITAVQILAVFAPAFIGGLLWQRASERGAFWSILTGFVLTIALLPFMPTTAFLPAILLSIIIFVVFSSRSSTIDF